MKKYFIDAHSLFYKQKHFVIKSLRFFNEDTTNLLNSSSTNKVNIIKQQIIQQQQDKYITFTGPNCIYLEGPIKTETLQLDPTDFDLNDIKEKIRKINEEISSISLLPENDQTAPKENLEIPESLSKLQEISMQHRTQRTSDPNTKKHNFTKL